MTTKSKEKKEPEATATREAIAEELGLEQEPESENLSPLQESEPYEEERRAYDRRRGGVSNWMGPERRKGDRRATKEFVSVAQPKASDIARTRLHFEKFRVVLWLGVLLLVPSVTYFVSGWERALAASCVAAAFYFVNFFFRINKN